MNQHPVDIQAGIRLRQRRRVLGMSQEEIGAPIGVTFQQIQKYEKGLNRMGASRLKQFADLLGVNVGYFFEETELFEMGMDELTLAKTYKQLSEKQQKIALKIMLSLVKLTNCDTIT